jgi:uroporphyrinogen-III synthase
LHHPVRGILITRPEPGASETAARLKAMGMMPIVAPVLEIAAVDMPPSRLDHIAGTLLTSRNAVGSCPVCCHGRPAFAVGDTTAMQARGTGFMDVHSAGADAVALAELVAATLDPRAGPLFLPAGQGQGQALARDLRARGFRVIRRVVYRAKLPDALPEAARRHLADGDVGAALFFSADSARHFVTLVRKAGLGDAVKRVEAVAISGRAIVPLSALPWRRISVAAKPNQDAMLALLS